MLLGGGVVVLCCWNLVFEDTKNIPTSQRDSFKNTNPTFSNRPGKRGGGLTWEASLGTKNDKKCVVFLTGQKTIIGQKQLSVKNKRL